MARQDRTIDVRRECAVSAAEMFAQIADHEGYVRLPGVRTSVLVQEGSPHRCGVGAIREVDLGSAWFRERIERFEPPSRLDYLILKSRPPVEHEFGRIELADTSSGCNVRWTSCFRVKIPLIGGLLTVLAHRQMSRAFAKALEQFEQFAREPRESEAS